MSRLGAFPGALATTACVMIIPAALYAAEDVLQGADRAFAQDDYETAESLYRQAVAERPSDAHALSRLALLLTWKGRYPEAIELYERAVRLQPGGIEPRRGLATAYTWSDDYDSALALYDELLGERPGDEGLVFEASQAQAWSGDFRGASDRLRGLLDRNPGHQKAITLLAQVELWSGNIPEAERLFVMAMEREPSHPDVLNGLGRVRAAQGRYDEALSLYDRVLSANPKDRAALEGRAEALVLQGRRPEALAAVRQTLELYPDARDARRLGRAIGGPLRPSLNLFASSIQDTDHNDLGQWGGDYTHHFGARFHVGASFLHAQTEATLGLDTPVARYDTLRATGGVSITPTLSLYGALGAERIDFPLTAIAGEHLNETRSHPAGSLALEGSPASWVTIIGTVSQEALVATTQAFMNDVRLRAFTLTGLFFPHPRVRLRVGGQRADFLDEEDWDVDSTFTTVADAPEENARWLATAGVTWRTPLRRPGLSLNYGMRWMAYDEPSLDHGYFDPEHYVSHLAGFDLSDTLGKSFYWSAGMDAGIQIIDRGLDGADDEDDNVLAWRLLAGVNLGESAAVEAYFVRSDLAAQTAAGFRSTEAGIRFRMRFGNVYGPAAPAAGSGQP